MKRVKIKIDRLHSEWLLSGKNVAIKVPAGADVVQIQLTVVPEDSSFAKVLDVFFNGRPA